MPNVCMMTSQGLYLDYKKILMTLTNLLVFSITEPFKVKVNPRVAAACLNDESKAYSEFIEHLSDDDDETIPANQLWLPRTVGHKEKNTWMSRLYLLLNVFHPCMFLYRCAKGLRKEVAHLTLGKLL
jgi:hypothetical protein